MRTNQRYLILLAACSQLVLATPLATISVGHASANGRYPAEARVEAVHQSSIAAQVPGQILALPVRAGDHVKKGQLLARLDDSAASQAASASQAMIGAANAQLQLAQRDYQRQKQLYASGYISQAAMDRAGAQYKASQAGARSQGAQAGAALAMARFYTLSAPYAGLVANVSAQQGDMAQPGMHLMTVYDPSSLKVIANVPQSVLPSLNTDLTAQIEIPGLAKQQRWLKAKSITVFPNVDAVSHTVEVRLDLAAAPNTLVPGTYARVWFAARTPVASSRLRIPARAVITRSELTGVYVVSNGRPLLRQIRLGLASGESVEVLSGLRPGENIAVDPLAAARWQQGN